MSLQILIFLTLANAPSTEAWQASLTAEQVPIQFTEKVDLTKHSGFLPLLVKGRKSGFYFLVEDFADLRSSYPALARLRLKEPVVYSLGFGANILECASAFYSASNLVAAFEGTAYDPQTGQFMIAKDLSSTAEECFQQAK